MRITQEKVIGLSRICYPPDSVMSHRTGAEPGILVKGGGGKLGFFLVSCMDSRGCLKTPSGWVQSNALVRAQGAKAQKAVEF